MIHPHVQGPAVALNPILEKRSRFPGLWTSVGISVLLCSLCVGSEKKAMKKGRAVRILFSNLILWLASFFLNSKLGYFSPCFWPHWIPSQGLHNNVRFAFLDE